MRKSWLPLFCLLIAAPFTAHAATVADARQLIDNVGKQALSAIESKGSKKEKQAKLEKLFVTNVDIAWVGRFVLGRYWRQATPEQRTRYLKEYQDFIVNNYAGRFADYTGGSYKLTGSSDDGEGQYTVSMLMISSDRQEVVVDYRVHTTEDGELKIFDVVVEGVSLINTQRSEFASLLASKDLEYLIGQLKAHAFDAPTGK